MLIVFTLMAIFGWGYSLFGVVNLGFLGTALLIFYAVWWSLSAWAQRRAFRDEVRREVYREWVKEQNAERERKKNQPQLFDEE